MEWGKLKISNREASVRGIFLLDGWSERASRQNGEKQQEPRGREGQVRKGMFARAMITPKPYLPVPPPPPSVQERELSGCSVLLGQRERLSSLARAMCPQSLTTGPGLFFSHPPLFSPPDLGQLPLTSCCKKQGSPGCPLGPHNGSRHCHFYIPKAQFLLDHLKRVFLPVAEKAEVFETLSVL